MTYAIGTEIDRDDTATIDTLRATTVRAVVYNASNSWLGSPSSPIEAWVAFDHNDFARMTRVGARQYTIHITSAVQFDIWVDPDAPQTADTAQPPATDDRADDVADDEPRQR